MLYDCGMSIRERFPYKSIKQPRKSVAKNISGNKPFLQKVFSFSDLAKLTEVSIYSVHGLKLTFYGLVHAQSNSSNMVHRLAV